MTSEQYQHNCQVQLITGSKDSFINRLGC